jgi:beta-1,4-mannosyltransferase
MNGRTAVAAFPPSVRGNPYCDLLYRTLEARGVRIARNAALSPWWIARHAHRVKVLHLHWPEFYYRHGGRPTARSVAAFVAALVTARALGYRVVWTVHNALPHERHPIDRALRWLLVRSARLVIHGDDARATLPIGRRAVTVVPHGNYVGCYPDDCTPAEARRRLRLAPEHRVFVCLGQLRAYKGVTDLLAAFAELPDAHVRLVVAGKPASDDDARAILAGATRDPRAQAHLRWIPDDELQVFLKAADFVVLPYRDVLTSGAAVLALSFGRPLVVPRRGCLTELEREGCAVAYDAGAPNGLRAALAAATRIEALDEWSRRAAAAAASRDWEPIAAAYDRVYRGA